MTSRIAGLSLLLVFTFSSCSPGNPPPAKKDSAWEDVKTRVALEQGWTPQIRELFWFTPQGSEIIPYGWFLALEQASTAELFRSTANMNRLRYIPEPPSGRNRDGLPIGFVEDIDHDGQAWLGFTCAACHTGQINFGGVGMVVDGAPAMADFAAFFDELIAAMEAADRDDDKFARFAQAVLGENPDEEASQQLRESLRKMTADVIARKQRNQPTNPPGFARVDAFGNILNQVLVQGLDVPENGRPPDAPVSYPVLWDTPQHDRVQWNGSAFNTGLGSLGRNVGEVLGVFGKLSITPKAIPPGYDSSVKRTNLLKLENWIKALWSPHWPSEHLPAIDEEKAKRGEKIYGERCIKCHALIDRANPNRKVEAMMIPLTGIGTDPAMATNFVTRSAKTGILNGALKRIIVPGPRFGSEAPAAEILKNAVFGVIIRPRSPLGITAESPSDELGDLSPETLAAQPQGSEPSAADLLRYKARPLNGIWASAPYLHNGSVPNLAQLLLPAAERVQQFHVGSREFDPRQVGFDTQEAPGTFLFDVTLPGNSNAGHEGPMYGTGLADAEREDLVEYLKKL